MKYIEQGLGGGAAQCQELSFCGTSSPPSPPVDVFTNLKALFSCTLLLPRVYRVLTATQHPQPLSHLKAFILPDPPQGSEFPLALLCLVSARKQFKSILAEYFSRV